MSRNDQAMKVRTLQIPFKSLVLKADPEFEQAKRKEPFYRFTRRSFDENTAIQGPYSTVPNDR